MQSGTRTLRHSVLRDLSVSAIAAGFVTVLVGFTSSAAIVFQAAQSLGATPEQISSWMWALGLGMGLTCIGLSLRYRMPVVTAWSTPGAAMLIGSAAALPISDAIGAFLLSALLITAVGFTGIFERMISRIPVSLASGMLGGVLLRFGLDAFAAMKTQLGLVLTMFAVYVVSRRLSPRYAVILTLLVGVAFAAAAGLLQTQALSLELARPVFVAPTFSFAAIVGIALPLFIVTMASQNIPGIAVLKVNHYDPKPGPLFAVTGVFSLLAAPFGGHAVNLAAITAAMCAGRDAHADPSRRYWAALISGVGYVILGLLAGAVTAFVALAPPILIEAVAGLALVGAFSGSAMAAFQAPETREAAAITFLVTASGVSFGGISGAFWGLVAGGLMLALSRIVQVMKK
jgi:benzoate membrane transport protein